MSDPPPPGPARLSWKLTAALGVVGSLTLLLGLLWPPSGRGEFDASFRIGELIGALAVWPLIIVGLFSIGRPFRTVRARAIIVLTVWSLFALTFLANGVKSRRSATPAFVVPPPRESPRSLSFATPGSLLPPGAVPAPGATKGAAPVAPKEAVVPVPSGPAAPLEFDFSKGSDQRLYDLVVGGEEQRYHAVVDAYGRACDERPGDGVLAAERVRFIERFMYLEDLSIKSAKDDLAVAEAYLKARFPHEPGTALFELRNTRDPAFDDKAEAYTESVPSWPPGDRAKFFLLRAQSANERKDWLTTEQFSGSSLDASVSVEASLLLAKAIQARGGRSQAVLALDRADFDTAPAWQKYQAMNLYFDLGQGSRAEKLYRLIKAEVPSYVANIETANRLAAAGQYADARAALASTRTSDLNRSKLLRERFDFELAHGSAAQAEAAYRALRSLGLVEDPLLRYRVALFGRYRGLAWNLQDLGGLAMLVLTTGLTALLPLAVLVPIHYWSLLRPERAAGAGWSVPGWGLRDAWLALGVLALTQMAGLWYFQPDLMRGWLVKGARTPAYARAALTAEEAVNWVALAAVLAVLLWRTRGWRLLSVGDWGFWKALGYGAGGAFAVRFGLGVFVLLFPQASSGQVAALAPSTQEAFRVMLGNLGPLGFVAVVAGLVPVLEELLFRGVVLQGLSRHVSFGLANLVQAATFGLLHGNLLLLPFYMALGLSCGALARNSRGLVSSIILHALNNLMACIAVLRIEHVL